MNQDLGAILQTIREVEESLDRRYSRALGTSVMIWGLVGACIFGFYQLVEINPAPYHAALGPFLSWVWTVPIALGYVASAILGTRMGRIDDEDMRRRLRQGLLPGVIISMLVTALLLTGRRELVAGIVVLLSGLASVYFAWTAPRTRPARKHGIGVGLAMTAAGLGILLASPTWANGLAALAFAIGYGSLGTVIYTRGR